MPAHYFLIEDLGSFFAILEARHYNRSDTDSWTTYSKVLSNTLVKHYAFSKMTPTEPAQIRVTYDLHEPLPLSI